MRSREAGTLLSVPPTPVTLGSTPRDPNSARRGAVSRLQGLGSKHGGLQSRENLFRGPQSS